MSPFIKAIPQYLNSIAMAKSDFVQQLQALGYYAQELAVQGRIFQVFDYQVPVGRFAGQTVRLGLEVRESFPMDAPPGPHFAPHLLGINTGGVHPVGGIHNSPLGAEWQYWSRPFSEWAQTDKTARIYLAHIKHLLDTV